MAVKRFSVSLETELVDRFDEKIREEGYPTRSKAVGDLIRASLVRTQWEAGEEVAGAVVLVYNRHRRDLVRRLTHVQHRWHEKILSSQHIHLSHDHCLEIVAVRGRARDVEQVSRDLKAVKGIKHAVLAAATTGERLP